jgi:N-acetylglucosaminyl-diphospho-decaprenol L-rhamnosyltransferase
VAHDLAVVVVSSPHQPHWLGPCLRTVAEHTGAVDVDVVVAANDVGDGTREYLEQAFPDIRVITCANRGFAHANNRALETCDARYLLLLNPDTEIREGTFEELVAALDARPEVGAAGVIQLTAYGRCSPTIRRFPNALRLLGDALGGERLPWRPRWIGERETDLDAYRRETPCDWMSGSFLLVRREALASAGLLDERFFLYAEETDLCLRIRQAGWDIRHLPTMTIVHHGKDGHNARTAAQEALSRKLYARKHFSPAHRTLFVAVLALRYLLRLAPAGRDRRDRAVACRRALRVLAGREAPPYGAPPPHALVRTTG